MARYNNWRSYGRKFRNYGTRARTYAGRGFRRAGGYARKGAGYVKRYQTRANQGFGPAGFKVYPDLPLAAGVGIGLTNIDRQIPGEIILAGAALPIGGKYGRSVRNFFGGVILGELFSRFTGFSLNIPAKTKTASVASIYA